MEERTQVIRSPRGTFLPGHSGFESRPGRPESYLRKNFRDNLPALCDKLMEMVHDPVVKCSTKASLIKLAFEYAEGKPEQMITVAPASPDTAPQDLTRLEMRARADALDPVILELQEEMKEAEEYQAFLDSKSKKKPKEKVVNETT